MFLHYGSCFNNKETITGISNSAGTLAAIISTIGTGYFVQWLGSFQAFLTITACLYVVTTIFWNLFATGEQVLWFLSSHWKITLSFYTSEAQKITNFKISFFFISKRKLKYFQPKELLQKYYDKSRTLKNVILIKLCGYQQSTS